MDTGLAPSPVPHFTVSKVTVPKPEHSYEVRASNIRQAENNLIDKSETFILTIFNQTSGKLIYKNDFRSFPYDETSVYPACLTCNFKKVLLMTIIKSETCICPNSDIVQANTKPYTHSF